MTNKDAQLLLLDHTVDRWRELYDNAICKYRESSNISHTLVGDKIFDDSDVVWASPVSAAPTTSSFST